MAANKKCKTAQTKIARKLEQKNQQQKQKEI